MNSSLEPTEEAYLRWQVDQSPQNLAEILQTLNPTINSEIQRYPGPAPLLRTEAKKLAIGAVRSYDPSAKTKLRSWVTTQLQPLTRYGREMDRPLHASEVAVRQAAEVETVRKRLVDELDDNPTDDQLADEIGISVKRIRQLRTLVRPVLSEQTMTFEEGGERIEPAVRETGTLPALETARQMVYASLDPRDKRIFEMKTGYTGKQVLDNMTIAKRLGVSPAFVSQRGAWLTRQLLETMARV